MTRRYRATLVAEFAIEAENIVEARRAAKRIRAIGEHCGARFPGLHDKYMTRHRVDCVLETVRVERARREGGGR